MVLCYSNELQERPVEGTFSRENSSNVYIEWRIQVHSPSSPCVTTTPATYYKISFKYFRRNQDPRIKYNFELSQPFLPKYARYSLRLGTSHIIKMWHVHDGSGVLRAFHEISLDCYSEIISRLKVLLKSIRNRASPRVWKKSRLKPVVQRAYDKRGAIFEVGRLHK